MPVSVSTEVYGVRDALRILGEIDKKQRLAATQRIKGAGGDMVAAAREPYPNDSELRNDLSGWTAKGRLGYQKAAVDRGVKLKIGGRSRGNSYAIVTLVQDNPAGALFDIAGLRDGSQGKPGGPDKLGRSRQPSQSKAFLRELDANYGKAQRGLWRNVKKIRELSEGNLMKALEQVAESVNRKLVR
jgi:hypothetical protein